MKLRPYQQQLVDETHAAWASGARNVMAVAPTGGGKTVVLSDIVRANAGASCTIAHRQELVTQISVALNRNAVPHRIIGPDSIIRLAVRLHMEDAGKSYFNPASRDAVAGVQTLLRRQEGLARWAQSVTLWVTDEGHHILRDNQWGKATLMFPNARGLAVTATPTRADGRGLGRHADGLMDVMVEGPPPRWLIDQKYLTDYRIFAPPSDLDLSGVTTSADGDYSKIKLKAAVRKSRVVGDVVKHYQRIAPGKLGITFATDVETATDIATQFNASGVPAEIVSAKTPDAERAAILRRFRCRELLQLVNVDLFGEGFDLPAIEVVSMARPTQSYSLFCQQFGRALRILEGKTEAIIIDHVGNVQRHGLPDRPRVWTLDAQERRSRGPTDTIPVTTCGNTSPPCMAVYERIHPACPYCGFEPVPASRAGPAFVDGDLHELDAGTLAQMRGEVARVDRPASEYQAELAAARVPAIGQMANVKRHRLRQDAQAVLRDAIAWWAGHQRAEGRGDPESYRRFYFAFGVDVLSAQALGTKEAEALTDRIHQHLTREFNVQINRLAV
jgi:superfamily II DNA or RNA helicase